MSNRFLNLEQVVRDWAWLEYDRTTTNSRQRKLRQKDKKEPRKYLSAELDWSETRFVDETLWSPLQSSADERDADTAAAAAASSDSSAILSAGRVQQRDIAQSGDPRGSVLFQTKFTNNTTDVQEYTMRTEKKTKTTLTTSVEHGFTRGVDMSVKLSAPGEVFEANAGYHREFTLTQCEGETFEEELTWGVESVIHVNQGHVAEASLVVNERKQSGKFTIKSRIYGPVYITFTAPRDNNSLVKTTVNDVAAIVEDFLNKERRKGHKMEFVRIEEDGAVKVVVVETTGNCRFRYGIKQEIRVDQKPLNSNK